MIMKSDRAIFIGFNALGDTLCTTPAIRAYRKMHPDAHITYVVQNATFTRILENNPHIDLLIYSDFMYVNGMTKYSQEWLYSLPLDFTVPSTLYYFDINQVCTTKEAFQEHISTGFSRLLNIPIESIRPEVVITKQEYSRAMSIATRPYVVISMHSNANPMREDEKGGSKEWPLENWQTLCEYIRSSMGCEIISIGSEFDPQIKSPLWKNRYGLPINIVAALLQKAQCVITLENGIGHLTHAVDATTVMLYSDIVPLGWANPAEASRCSVLYGDPHVMSVNDVIAEIDKLVSKNTCHTEILTKRHENLLLQ